MSHRDPSVRDRLTRRLRGAVVLATCAGLGLPLLLATGGTASVADDVLAAARAQVGDTYVCSAGPCRSRASSCCPATWSSSAPR